MREKEVFLCVVEIWFKLDAGVGFFVGGDGGAEVDAVVFCAGLEEDAVRVDRGEGERGEEVGEEGC